MPDSVPLARRSCCHSAPAESGDVYKRQLHYWVYGRRHTQAPKSVAIAPVFQELKVTAALPPQSWAAEISLPTGAVARFTATATPAWIDSVLEGLRRPC